jgi:polygalacturonase
VPDGLAQTALAVNRRPNSPQSWDLRQFGVKGDGKKFDTRAVRVAIDACHQAGGGAIHFATGYTFLIGTIYLKDHVELHLDSNSVLLGGSSPADYGKDVGMNPFYPETIDPCLIYAKGCVDIRIGATGPL